MHAIAAAPSALLLQQSSRAFPVPSFGSSVNGVSRLIHRSAGRFLIEGPPSAGSKPPSRALRCSRVLAVHASAKSEKWLLQPIGDGDCSHLDEAVPLPGVFELSIDAATVGRVPGKADIVIPVATVSGLHARLERKSGTLYITDLDSTNGTYVNDRQIRPGAVTPVPPGSRVTFGDDHLAAFKFDKVEEETPPQQS